MNTSTEFTVEATIREDLGKGASRRLRREQGLIPGVVYGAGKAAKSITLSHDAMLHNIEKDGFASSLINLIIDGSKPEKVLLKDLQMHPYKPKVVHADFLRVKMNVAIAVTVPVSIVGEEECPGIKEGGVVAQTLTEVEVKCMPKDLPETLTIDITETALDTTLHLTDIKLPAGVVLSALDGETEDNKAVLSISVPKVAEEPAESDEDTAEGTEAAEGSDGEKAEGGDDAAASDAEGESSEG